MPISDIIAVTSGKPSSSAARLSELVQMDWVERVGRGEYRITTFGIKSFTDTILPKLKALL
jgi:DNA-binding IclR family transcriptional regulator